MRGLPPDVLAIEEHDGGILLVKRLPAETYRNVVVALDLGPGSEELLASALSIAPSARITAVHAYEVPYEGALFHAGVPMAEIQRHRGKALAEAFARIEELAALVTRHPQRIVSLVERSHPVQLVLDAARSLRADLIVVAWRPRPLIDRLVRGSVSREVIARASCDVLVPVELPPEPDYAPGSTRSRSSAARPSSR